MTQPLTDAINALTRYANETTGADDPDLSSAVRTLCDGYGGGGDVALSVDTVSYGSSRWEFNSFTKSLEDGYVLETEWYYPDITDGEYPALIAIGGTISGWNYENAVGVYIRYSSTSAVGTKYIVVRQNKVSTNHNVDDLDFSVPHTVKIDKDYVYLDGVPVVQTNANALNVALTAIGSYEGANRFKGTYNYIKYYKPQSA